MAREPFLINPPRRRRVRARRRRNAWFESTATAPYSPRHAAAAVRGWKRKGKKAKPRYAGWKRKANPFGEEVIIMGANPRRRHRRRRTVNRVHRRRRSFRRSYGLNPRRKRRSYARRRYNPIRRRRSHRRHRRNPAAAASIGSFSLSRPSSLLMPIAVGIAAKIALDKIPAMLGTTFSTGIMKHVGAAAIAVGGSMLTSKFLGKQAGNIFMLFAGTTVAWNLVNEYVLNSAVTTAGLGNFIPYVPPASNGALAGFTNPYDSERYGY